MHSKTIWPAFTADTNLSFCLPLHAQLKSFPQTVATHSHRHTNSFPVFPVTAASNLLTILQLFVCHWEQVSGFTRIVSSRWENFVKNVLLSPKEGHEYKVSIAASQTKKKMFYKSIQSKLFSKKGLMPLTVQQFGKNPLQWNGRWARKTPWGESADAGSRFLPSVSQSAVIKVQLFLVKQEVLSERQLSGGKLPPVRSRGG